MGAEREPKPCRVGESACSAGRFVIRDKVSRDPAKGGRCSHLCAFDVRWLLLSRAHVCMVNGGDRQYVS